jgi:hypothetical protein
VPGGYALCAASRRAVRGARANTRRKLLERRMSASASIHPEESEQDKS